MLPLLFSRGGSCIDCFASNIDYVKIYSAWICDTRSHEYCARGGCSCKTNQHDILLWDTKEFRFINTSLALLKALKDQELIEWPNRYITYIYINENKVHIWIFSMSTWCMVSPKHACSTLVHVRVSAQGFSCKAHIALTWRSKCWSAPLGGWFCCSSNEQFNSARFFVGRRFSGSMLVTCHIPSFLKNWTTPLPVLAGGISSHGNWLRHGLTCRAEVL